MEQGINKQDITDFNLLKTGYIGTQSAFHLMIQISSQ